MIATAECPTHGRQAFVYNRGCDWWECPDADFVGGTCVSVIPAEVITDDGADVVQATTIVPPI